MDRYAQLGRHQLDAATGRRAIAPIASAPTDGHSLKQHLPAGAKLWVNLPPPRELAAKLVR